MKRKTQITHEHVLDYFGSVSPEMAALVHDLAGQRIREAAAKREQLGARLSKARKAKGRGRATAAVGVTADPAVEADMNSQLGQAQPNRRAEAQRARRQRETGQQGQNGPEEAGSMAV